MNSTSNTLTSPGRHCMVVHHIYPIAEPRVERDARALISHGYEVDVICLINKGEPRFEVVDGVNVYRLPVERDKRRGAAGQLLEYLAFFFLAFFKLVQLHVKRRYGVVQVHTLPDFLVFAALLPKLTGARVILDIHDVMPEFYAARFNRRMDSLPVRLVRWEEKLSCWFADHVVTVTERWRQDLIARGLPAAKVSVVMNLADERIFRWRSWKTFSVTERNDFKLIYHGQITRRYGLDLLVRAIEKLRQVIPEIHLTVIGAGDFRDAVVQLVNELSLQKYVSVREAVPLAELPELIQRVDVGVAPYRRDVFTDGCLPTKLLEYMALGVPAIAARTPVITDYFDETVVEFFNPGDLDDLVNHIYALYSNPARLGELARNTAKFNQRYNWTKIGAEYVSLVERMNRRQVKHISLGGI